IHSRLEEEEAEWTKNASGTLAEGEPQAPEALGEWPPAGAEETYAEATLPEELSSDGFLVHPALLESALQPVLAADGEETRRFTSFAGASLSEGAGGELRVRVRAATTQPFDPAELRLGAGDPLYLLEWQAIPSP